MEEEEKKGEAVPVDRGSERRNSFLSLDPSLFPVSETFCSVAFSPFLPRLNLTQIPDPNPYENSRYSKTALFSGQ